MAPAIASQLIRTADWTQGKGSKPTGASAAGSGPSTVAVIVNRNDAMYQFFSTIKRAIGKGGRQFILSPPRRYERVQRRMFARVNMQTKLSYSRIVPLGDWQSYDDRRWRLLMFWRDIRLLGSWFFGALSDNDTQLAPAAACIVLAVWVACLLAVIPRVRAVRVIS